MSISQGEFDVDIFGSIGEASTKEKLFQIATQVSVSVLQIALHSEAALAKLGIPEIHIPGSGLRFIDLGLGFRSKKDCRKKQ
jgi:hypothetical protein